MFTPDTLGWLPETPSQTAGPYVHIGLIPKQAGFDIFENNLGESLLIPETKGERIRIEGRILDGTGSLVRDALVETWQADSFGRYASPNDRQPKPRDESFRGWARTGTDFETGLWGFDTIKPGRVMGRNGRLMAPHISVWIVARGINIGLSTRIYFSDEDNSADPVLGLIEQVPRRDTLIARREDRDGLPVFRFDIRLQGEGETVFLDI